MKKIRTALCSFGMSGRVFHAPFIHRHTGFELYAALERSRDDAREQYPGIKTFRTFEEMIHDESIELLIINTPNNTHFDYAMAGLESGKHVIVEKPFTIKVTEAASLVQQAEKVNKKLTVYHNRRWDSDFKTVQEVIRKRSLGNIVEAEFHFDRYKTMPGPKLHKELPGPGTGIVYDLGSHLIDQALQLFGMPLKIFADIQIIRGSVQVDDYMEIILYYERMRIRLKGSYLVKEPLPAYILHGTSGSFIKPRADVQETDLKIGKDVSDADWGKEPENGKGLLHIEWNGKDTREYIPSLQGNYMEFYDLMYTAIRNNDPLPVTGIEGMHVIRIIEAAYQSVREKKIIVL